ncbi:MAG: tRNA (guanosine(37)-N1)-methyltransferase TrmD [Pseudomonadota bacterium]|nr:tRNA (guanosine(37)-N1)-methyltransferase TrmD [Pseudomonadota bacterium]MEC9077205.1 tRNA (guanosine(37)-N1)-methyltransferase TrmD [Pseudomonadota bacterium]
MKWGVITLFPTMVADALAHGVIGRALQRGLIDIITFNPRAHATDLHQTVDDRPYGGGPGMLMKVETLRASIAEAKKTLPEAPVIYLSPQGEPLTQAVVQELTERPEVILVCGRYEGIDERVIELDVDYEISLGDFVLSGGEPAAIAVMDAVGRLVPGVLGHASSAAQDSFSDGLLDCPHYTRPEEIAGLKVPDVLLSGHHVDIARWRRKQALGRTWLRRSGILERQDLSDEDQLLLDEFIRESKP